MVPIPHALCSSQHPFVESWCLERRDAHIPPPRALIFHSPSVAWVNVLPVRSANIASNLSTTKIEKHGVGH